MAVYSQDAHYKQWWIQDFWKGLRGGTESDRLCPSRKIFEILLLKLRIIVYSEKQSYLCKYVYNGIQRTWKQSIKQ